jgi:hypothetical protein
MRKLTIDSFIGLVIATVCSVSWADSPGVLFGEGETVRSAPESHLIQTHPEAVHEIARVTLNLSAFEIRDC